MGQQTRTSTGSQSESERKSPISSDVFEVRTLGGTCVILHPQKETGHTGCREGLWVTGGTGGPVLGVSPDRRARRVKEREPVMVNGKDFGHNFTRSFT